MKTALKVVGGLILLCLVAIVTIPLFINVDKYRPQIVNAANEQINGKLQLGALSLNLWGGIHVGIDGLTLTDLQGHQLVSVKDSSFDLPYSSIFSGSPLITLSMKQPNLLVVKTKDGKLNVMSLMKPAASPAPGSAAATGSNVTANSNASAQKVELPAMAMNARVGISIQNAKLVYRDEAMNLSNTIDNLNLMVKDFSLSRTTEMELWADLKTQMGTDTKVEGPLKLIAQLKPEISGGDFKSATVVATFTADDLSIEKGTLFHKAKGVPMNFKFDGSLTQDSLKLNNATANFHNAQIVVKGEYHKEAGANINFDAKPIELKSWSELIPMLKEYELEGALGLTGDFKGKPEAMQYHAKLSIKNFAAKGPNLKAKPVINGEVDVATDQIEKMVINLSGPGNEILFDMKLVSFAKPQITFNLRSPKGLDLDQWIEFPKTETAAASAKSNAAPTKEVASGGSAKGSAAAEDLDAMLDPVRKNEMLRGIGIDGNFALAFVKAKGNRIDDIGGKFQMKNLVIGLTGFHMKMYDGTIAGSFTTDLKPKEPQYNMSLSVAGFDIQKAVETQFQAFKNTLIGKLNASLQGGGASFNADTAKRRLQMKGEFKLANAMFKTMDIAKMAGDAINGSIGKMASKIPVLQGKTISVPAKGDSHYEMVSSNFTIQNGMLDAPNFYAKAAPGKGIDVKGATKMGLIDESLDAKWELIDAQKMTGANQVSVQVAGKTLNNILAKGENDPVIIPISVGCKWSAPCTKYDQTAEYLAGVVANRLSKAAPDIIKAKAQDMIKKAVGGGNIGDGLKKLFGH